MSLRLKVAAVGVAAALSLLGASSAGATTTVTLGSPLTATFNSQAVSTSSTVRQTTLPGATLAAPFNGVITSWKINSATVGWALQVIHPVGGGLFTSTASTHTGALSGGTVTFTANLPIKAGDSIGLASDSDSARLGVASTPGATFDAWTPPLSDNAPPRAPTPAPTPLELGFNATVAQNCVVPKVKGKTLKKAKKKLLAANCTKGKVKKRGGKKITKQKPAPGTELAPNAPVKLTLG